MTEANPRQLSERERGVLGRLLAEDLPGVNQLRQQAEVTQVRGLLKDLPGIVLLAVERGNAAPRAEVVHTVPVEGRVRGTEPPVDVLLFVKDGYLDSIEVVDYSGADPLGLPAPGNLDVAVSAATDRRPHPSDGTRA